MAGGTSKSKNSRQAAYSALRQRQALELRAKGCSYTEIGSEMHVTASTAYGLVNRALASTPGDEVDAVRQVELARLDRSNVAVEALLDKWMPYALGEALIVDDEGDLVPQKVPSVDAARAVMAALDAKLKIADRRWKWSGAEAAAAPAPDPSQMPTLTAVDQAIMELVERHQRAAAAEA